MNKVDILIACDLNKSRPWYRDRIPSINNAIENGNYKIKLIDIYDSLGQYKYMPTNTNERKHFLQNENLLLANKKFEDKVIEISPRVLLLGTADNYKEFLIPKTLKSIRSKGIFVSGILGDDEFNYESNKFLLGWFDLFVAYVKPCVNYYESLDITKGYFLPNSCYLSGRKFESLSQETEYEIILMGAPFAKRPFIVKSLIENGLKVGIYGSQKWLEHKFAEKNYYGYVETENFNEVLAKGKIVLALLEDHISGNLHMNTKIWEAVRVGRLPICTYYEPLFNDYGLTEGVDIVTYRDIDELVSKAKYYIQNEKERTRIIENLYLKVQTEFDYSILYSKLFDKLLELEKANNYSLNPTLFKAKSLFPISNTNKIDEEVHNILSIVNRDENKSYNFIYFNSIENGKRVISRWPFISLSNIIFFKKSKTIIGYLFMLITSINKNKRIHVNQFCIVKEKLTLIGRLNRVIDKLYFTLIKNK